MRSISKTILILNNKDLALEYENTRIDDISFAKFKKSSKVKFETNDCIIYIDENKKSRLLKFKE